MEKKYLSDCIRYTTDIAPYPFIQIYSGVGSGKNTFVDALAKGYEESQPDGRMETLEPKRVLCITSRRAKVDELKNAEDVAYGTQVLEYESLDYVEDLDSYFASKRELSCNGIWGTIPIYQRSIACTNAAIERYLEKHYRADKAEDFRGVQLRKHSKAREKRYSFGYAVSFIFACYQILWTFPKSRYLCSRYLPLACG